MQPQQYHYCISTHAASSVASAEMQLHSLTLDHNLPQTGVGQICRQVPFKFEDEVNYYAYNANVTVNNIVKLWLRPYVKKKIVPSIAVKKEYNQGWG